MGSWLQEMPPECIVGTVWLDYGGVAEKQQLEAAAESVAVHVQQVLVAAP